LPFLSLRRRRRAKTKVSARGQAGTQARVRPKALLGGTWRTQQTEAPLATDALPRWSFPEAKAPSKDRRTPRRAKAPTTGRCGIRETASTGCRACRAPVVKLPLAPPVSRCPCPTVPAPPAPPTSPPKPPHPTHPASAAELEPRASAERAAENGLFLKKVPQPTALPAFPAGLTPAVASETFPAAAPILGISPPLSPGRCRCPAVKCCQPSATFKPKKGLRKSFHRQRTMVGGRHPPGSPAPSPAETPAAGARSPETTTPLRFSTAFYRTVALRCWRTAFPALRLGREIGFTASRESGVAFTAPLV